MRIPHHIPKSGKHDLRVGFLSELRPRVLKEFDSIKLRCAHSAREVLFMEGQPARGVYVLRAGDVKLSVSSTEGKTLILDIAKPGRALGLVPALSGTAHELTAETLTFCQLAFFPRDGFLRLLAKYPEAYAAVAIQVSSQYQIACDQLRNFALSASAPERLAKLLLDFAVEGQDVAEDAQIKFGLTHERIAQFIGTTRETVTRTLREFSSRRLAHLRGGTLVIEDRQGLKKLATF